MEIAALSSFLLPSLELRITELNQVGDARRQASEYLSTHSLNETDRYKISIVVSELASNLAKHAKDGRLLISAYGGVIDLLSIDHGPGILNLDHALQDGHSTAGTSGNGLGAIRRQSDVFDVYSEVNRGTVILARFGAPKYKFLYGAVCVPIRGESKCGDAFAWKETENQTEILMADGLGHGVLASTASSAAVECFLNSDRVTQDLLFQKMHGALRITRGAAVSILTLNALSQVASYTGVGNVSGTLSFPSTIKKMVSHNGTVGQNMRKTQEFAYSMMNQNPLALMYTDGLQSQVDLSAYPFLYTKHPAVIAGVLYRDFTRGRDDATILICKRVNE